MKKIICFHGATQIDGGEYQRIRKLQNHIFSSVDCHFTECLFTRIPTSANTILQLYRSPPLIAGQRRLIFPILLPATRFGFVRKINQYILRACGFLLGLIFHPDMAIGETTTMWDLVRWCAIAHPPSISWLDFHGAMPEEVLLCYPNRSGTKRFAMELRCKENRVAKEADVITCQSGAMISHLESAYGKKLLNAHVYHCGVDTDMFAFDNEKRIATRKAFGFTSADRLIVYAGGIHPWQKFPETLRMIAALHAKDSRYKGIVLTGWDQDEINRIARACSLPTDSFVVKSVPHWEVPSCLVAADVGVLLRDDSTVNRVACPTKLGEYLACGLPIITGPVAKHWAWTSSVEDISFVVEHYNVEKCTDLIANFIEVVFKNSEVLRYRCRKIAIDTLSMKADADMVARIIHTYTSNKK